MTVLGFTVQRASVDTAGKWPCWNLLDASGKVVGQTTDPALIPDMIAAKHLTALLAFNSSRAGLLESSYARYQVAEDCFNDPDGIRQE